MKVLHLPYGPAMIDLCEGLRKKGVDATDCHFTNNHYHFKPTFTLGLENWSIEEQKIKREIFFKECINDFDLFHFHFGETFFSDKSDLDLLKNAGKKMIVHHHGSEVRKLSLAKRKNQYVRVKPEWTEEKIHQSLLQLSHYMEHAIVQDAELASYIEPYYKKTHIIPHGLNLMKYNPQYPKPSHLPLIVHAPTRRDLKGTEFILHTCQVLKKKGYRFELKLIENLSYEEAQKMLSQADIVIDQLRIGSYGFVSTEAMAYGKPVICYIREDLKMKYPSDLPILSCAPHELFAGLSMVLSHPQKWRTIGEKGRTYVERHHNIDSIVAKYIEIYESLS